MNNPRKLCLIIIAGTLALACINTTYSRLDEVEITDELVHLILGQFAHHGPTFYEHEVIRNATILEKDKNSFDARNDLGAAYLKLERWNDAEAEFLANDTAHPDRYRTHSNLGVLYKKSERYPESAASIRKALMIQPEGHMGLGDYYLQMIEWLGNNAAETEKLNPPEAKINPRIKKVRYAPTANFLDIPYSTPFADVATDARVNREYLITLVKNDYRFPDVYVVLGDVLRSEGEYQLALRSYLRAENLGHPAPSTVMMRITALTQGMKHTLPPGHIIEPYRIFRHQFTTEVDAASAWRAKLHEVEVDQLDKGLPADFKTTKALLETLGTEKPRVLEIAAYRGKTSESQEGTFLIIKLCTAIFIAGAAFLVLKKIFYKPQPFRAPKRRTDAS